MLELDNAKNRKCRPPTTRPSYKLSVELLATYKRINEIFYEEKRKKGPKRSLYNNGYDDEQGNYICETGEEINGRYIVQQYLGKGSFGVVVKAVDHTRDEKVAIKIIKNKSQFLNQAKVEIDILNKLNGCCSEEHNVVHLKRVFTWKDHLCLVFELLSDNLYDLLRQTEFKGVPLSTIKKFAYQLLKTLEFLSLPSVGVIHCDLKPENILLRHPKRSAIKAIDFGSSCYVNKRMFKYIQSRFYRAPEVVLGLPYDCAIDMWSLACILVEMHTGRPLFDGRDEAEQMCKFSSLLNIPPQKMIDTSPKKKNFFQFDQKNKRWILGPPNKDINKYQKRELDDVLGVFTGGPSGRRKDTPGHSEQDYMQFSDLLRKMLVFCPKDRMTPKDALQHPFLATVVANITNTKAAPLNQQTTETVYKSPSAPRADEAPVGKSIPLSPSITSAYNGHHHQSSHGGHHSGGVHGSTSGSHTHRSRSRDPHKPETRSSSHGSHHRGSVTTTSAGGLEQHFTAGTGGGTPTHAHSSQQQGNNTPLSTSGGYLTPNNNPCGLTHSHTMSEALESAVLHGHLNGVGIHSGGQHSTPNGRLHHSHSINSLCSHGQRSSSIQRERRYSATNTSLHAAAVAGHHNGHSNHHSSNNHHPRSGASHHTASSPSHGSLYGSPTSATLSTLRPSASAYFGHKARHSSIERSHSSPSTSTSGHNATTVTTPTHTNSGSNAQHTATIHTTHGTPTRAAPSNAQATVLVSPSSGNITPNNNSTVGGGGAYSSLHSQRHYSTTSPLSPHHHPSSQQSPRAPLNRSTSSHSHLHGGLHHGSHHPQTTNTSSEIYCAQDPNSATVQHLHLDTQQLVGGRKAYLGEFSAYPSPKHNGGQGTVDIGRYGIVGSPTTPTSTINDHHTSTRYTSPLQYSSPTAHDLGLGGLMSPKSPSTRITDMQW